MNRVGPTTSTKAISSVASTMFSSERFFTPLSSPATTEQTAMAVITTIAMICTPTLTGTSHR